MFFPYVQNDAAEGRVRERKGIPDYQAMYSPQSLSQPLMRLQPFTCNTNLAIAVPQSSFLA